MSDRCKGKTCTTKQNVPALYEKLKDIEIICYVALYKAVNNSILLEWVTTHMTQEAIKGDLEVDVDTVLKIIDNNIVMA